MSSCGSIVLAGVVFAGVDDRRTVRRRALHDVVGPALGMFGFASALMIVGWLTMTDRPAFASRVRDRCCRLLGCRRSPPCSWFDAPCCGPSLVLQPAWRTAAVIAIVATVALGAATGAVALDARRSVGVDSAPRDITANAGTVSLGCGVALWLLAGVFATTSWLTTTGDGIQSCGSIVSPDQYGAWDDQSTCGVIHLGDTGDRRRHALRRRRRRAHRVADVNRPDQPCVSAPRSLLLWRPSPSQGAVVHVWRAATWPHPSNPDFAVAWDRIAVLTTTGAVLLAVVAILMALEASGNPRWRASRQGLLSSAA